MPSVKANQHHQPAVTRIVIDSGKFIPSVAPSRCKPKEKVALVFVNNDTVEYQVRLTNFMNKVNLPATAVNQSDLFVVATSSHQVDPDDTTIVRRKIKPAGNWGTAAGKFPYTSYECDLELWDKNGTTQLDTLDPDFDITP